MTAGWPNLDGPAGTAAALRAATAGMMGDHLPAGAGALIGPDGGSPLGMAEDGVRPADSPGRRSTRSSPTLPSGFGARAGRGRRGERVVSIQSWDESPAGLLARRAAFPGDDRLARLEAAELDRQEARSAWEARLAADPGWQADRQRQLAVAAHIVGRGQVINIGAVVPPELAPLYAAAAARAAVTWNQPRRPGGG